MAAKSGKLHGFLPCKLRFVPAIVGGNNLWPNARLDETTCPCFYGEGNPRNYLKVMMKSLAQRPADIRDYFATVVRGNRILCPQKSYAVSKDACVARMSA